jgi:hypothetical protein
MRIMYIYISMLVKKKHPELDKIKIVLPFQTPG